LITQKFGMPKGWFWHERFILWVDNKIDHIKILNSPKYRSNNSNNKVGGTWRDFSLVSYVLQWKKKTFKRKIINTVQSGSNCIICYGQYLFTLLVTEERMASMHIKDFIALNIFYARKEFWNQPQWWRFGGKEKRIRSFLVT
jgi:hypothetical protein